MNRQRTTLVSFSLVALAIAAISCGVKGGVGAGFGIPKVTGSVTGSSAAASLVIEGLTEDEKLTGILNHQVGRESLTATTGKLLSTGSCSGCSTTFTAMYGMTSAFISQGDIADQVSCTIQAMVDNEVIANLADGSTHYAKLSAKQSMRLKIVQEGGVIKSYSIAQYGPSSQSVSMTGTRAGKDMTFVAKIAISATFRGKIEVAGKYADYVWTDKKLTMTTEDTATPASDTKFILTQGSNYVQLQGVNGVTLASSARLFSKSELIGTGPATYALGDGSAAISFNNAAATKDSWSGDSGASLGSITSGVYYAAIATPDYLTPATPTDMAFTTDEAWDGTTGTDTATDLSAVAVTDTSPFVTALLKCQKQFP